MVAVWLLLVASSLYMFLHASVYSTMKTVGPHPPQKSHGTSEVGHATVMNAANVQSFMQTLEVLMAPFVMGIF